MPKPNIVRLRKVASALRKHARTMSGFVRWSKATSKMYPPEANTFLLGVILDRSVQWQRAWDAAEWICKILGKKDDVAALWTAIAEMEPVRLRGFLRYGYGGKAFHRHYKTFSNLLPQAANHLLELYSGDPRKIWNNQTDVQKVKKRLEEIPGIGPALANFAVLCLARDYGLLGGKKARQQLDVKPDMHVQRVFYRAGLVPRGAKPQDVVNAARQLAPDFPASLDVPAWDIGRNWFRPRHPGCLECPIGGVCPRVGLEN